MFGVGSSTNRCNGNNLLSSFERIAGGGKEINNNVIAELRQCVGNSKDKLSINEYLGIQSLRILDRAIFFDKKKEGGVLNIFFLLGSKIPKEWKEEYKDSVTLQLSDAMEKLKNKYPLLTLVNTKGYAEVKRLIEDEPNLLLISFDKSGVVCLNADQKNFIFFANNILGTLK